jgi:hypothetical protein
MGTEFQEPRCPRGRCFQESSLSDDPATQPPAATPDVLKGQDTRVGSSSLTNLYVGQNRSRCMNLSTSSSGRRPLLMV